MMAKYWLAGRVKTRLAEGCNVQIAAEIHELSTRHLLENLRNVADSRTVLTSPDHHCEDMRLAARHDWIVAPQGDGDLGLRMSRAFQSLMAPLCDTSVARDATPYATILIGADLPTLTPAELEEAFSALQQCDAVVGPAVDGGYYLIGLRGPWKVAYESLFESIPWSTEVVFDRTIEAFDRQSLAYRRLAIREDIDTFDDLRRLVESATTPFELRDSISKLFPPSTFRPV
jgi:uncharacterized protein